MSKQVFRIIAFVMLAFVGVQCDNYVPNSNIPDVRVYEQINLSLPEWAALRGVGNAVAYNDVCTSCSLVGYNGILIVKGADGLMYAFDQCCTHNPEERHKVKPNGALGKCETCGSVFQLLDGLGAVTKGPATLPLRQYKTTVVNNVLLITN